jgi:hypothetical protein
MVREGRVADVDKVEASPTTLKVAVWLLLLQAAALALLTLYLVYLDVTATSSSVEGAVSTTVFVGLMAAAFTVVGVSLSRRRRWARGPAIVVEMLQVPIGYTMLTHGLPVVGAPVLLFGVVGAGLLLAPSTRRALGLD